MKSKKKIVYTSSHIKPKEKSDRKVFSRASLVGRTNPRRSWDIKLGDNVIVISGSDKGIVGKVLRVWSTGKILVEGVNVKTKNKKASLAGQAGEIIQKEFPIWIWKVAICVKDGDEFVPTRIKKDSNGKRIAVKTGELID